MLGNILGTAFMTILGVAPDGAMHTPPPFLLEEPNEQELMEILEHGPPALNLEWRENNTNYERPSVRDIKSVEKRRRFVRSNRQANVDFKNSRLSRRISRRTSPVRWIQDETDEHMYENRTNLNNAVLRSRLHQRQANAKPVQYWSQDDPNRAPKKRTTLKKTYTR